MIALIILIDWFHIAEIYGDRLFISTEEIGGSRVEWCYSCSNHRAPFKFQILWLIFPRWWIYLSSSSKLYDGISRPFFFLFNVILGVCFTSLLFGVVSWCNITFNLFRALKYHKNSHSLFAPITTTVFWKISLEETIAGNSRKMKKSWCLFQSLKTKWDLLWSRTCWNFGLYTSKVLHYFFMVLHLLLSGSWIFVYAYLCMLTVNHEQLNPRNDNYAANLFARFIFVQYQDFWKLSYVAL